jgi:molybdopterin-guanine dinucleotide biosynthesis protein
MMSEPLPQTLIERAAKSSRRKTLASTIARFGLAIIDALFVEGFNKVTKVCARGTYRGVSK